MDLKGKAALVTGGGTGLGRAIAAALAERGADVALSYSRSADDARRARDELRGLGVRAETFQADLAEPTAGERLVEEARAAMGRLDVLVNNAATTVWVPFRQLDAVVLDDWDQIMGLNLRAPFVLCRAFARAVGDEGGTIVNVASLAGLRPGGSSIPYSVSKAALIHLSRCLAVALQPRVRVNVVAPSSMDTGWGARTGMPPEEDDDPGVSVADVVKATLYLVESEAETGQVIPVDGGRAIGVKYRR